MTKNDFGKFENFVKCLDIERFYESTWRQTMTFIFI